MQSTGQGDLNLVRLNKGIPGARNKGAAEQRAGMGQFFKRWLWIASHLNEVKGSAVGF